MAYQHEPLAALSDRGGFDMPRVSNARHGASPCARRPRPDALDKLDGVASRRAHDRERGDRGRGEAEGLNSTRRAVQPIRSMGQACGLRRTDVDAHTLDGPGRTAQPLAWGRA